MNQPDKLISFKIAKPVSADIHTYNKTQVRFTTQLPESMTRSIDNHFAEYQDNLKSKSLILRDLAPKNPLLDVVFPMVILKKSSDTDTYSITFYAKPKNMERKHLINSEDFKESHFDIVLDFNRNINTAIPGKLVGYLVRLTPYDLHAIEHLSNESRFPRYELMNLRDIYSKLGLTDIDGTPLKSKGTPQQIDIMCIGNIMRIQNYNQESEAAYVHFKRVFILDDMIRRKFNRNIGISSDASSISIRNRINIRKSGLFGASPHIIRKDIRKIKNNGSGLFAYKTRSTFSKKLYKDGSIPTNELITLGNNVNINKQLENHPAINYQNKIDNVSNPFKCMNVCEKDGQCDIYNQVKNTCNLYGLKDSKEGQYRTAMNYLFKSKTPAVYSSKKASSAQKQDMEQNDIVFDRLSYAGFVGEEQRNEINRRLQKIESHQKLYMDIWNIKSESFTNRDSSILESDIVAYDQAYQQALSLDKQNDLANTQAKFALKDKIYYNLATIGLWIINIGLLIGILYVLFIGFFGGAEGVSKNVLEQVTQNALPQQQLYGNRPSVYNQ